MVELIVSLGRLSIGFLCLLGPVVVLFLLLHIHEQRKTVLLTSVLRELNRPDLRGLVRVSAQSGLFGADTVELGLRHCLRDQAWGTIEKISAQLAEHVRIEVNGIADCRARSTWELRVMRTRPSVWCCPL
jgi:hypothetical protein